MKKLLAILLIAPALCQASFYDAILGRMTNADVAAQRVTATAQTAAAATYATISTVSSLTSTVAINTAAIAASPTTYQTQAGADIRWVNIIPAGDFSQGVQSWGSGASAIASATGYVYFTDTTTTGGRTFTYPTSSVKFTASHKYVAYFDLDTAGSNVLLSGVRILSTTTARFATTSMLPVPAANSRTQCAVIFTATSSGTSKPYFSFDGWTFATGTAATGPVKFYRAEILDLGVPGNRQYGLTTSAVIAGLRYNSFFSGTSSISPLPRFAMSSAIPSYWSNYEVSFLGDSITAQGWSTPASTRLNLSQTLLGVGGSCIAGTGTTAFHLDARIATIPTTAKIVVIMGGANDWAQSNTIGVLTGTDINSTDTGTYVGALNTVISKVYTRVPTAKIILCTPSYAILANRGGWSDTTGHLNTLGLHISDYAAAVRAVGLNWGIPVCDIYAKSQINLSNYTLYLASENSGNDYIHPKATGQAALSQVFYGFMMGLEPF